MRAAHSDTLRQRRGVSERPPPGQDTGHTGHHGPIIQTQGDHTSDPGEAAVSCRNRSVGDLQEESCEESESGLSELQSRAQAELCSVKNSTFSLLWLRVAQWLGLEN